MVIISKMAPFIHVGGFPWKIAESGPYAFEYNRAFSAQDTAAHSPVLMHNVPHQFLFAYTVFHPHMAFCRKLVVKMAAVYAK